MEQYCNFLVVAYKGYFLVDMDYEVVDHKDYEVVDHKDYEVDSKEGDCNLVADHSLAVVDCIEVGDYNLVADYIDCIEVGDYNLVADYIDCIEVGDYNLVADYSLAVVDYSLVDCKKEEGCS